MDKKEYIEREALIRKIMERREERSRGEEPPEVELIRRVDHNDFIFMTAHQPAADMVEVVRCKDCAVPHNTWTGCPKLSGLVTQDDFYCAFGEKKEK